MKKWCLLPDDLNGASARPFKLLELTAELFGVLAAPMRLRIIKSLCHSEKNASELMSEINTTQPNMSSHLNTLYKAGLLGRRRVGNRVYYYVVDSRALMELLSLSRVMVGK